MVGRTYKPCSSQPSSQHMRIALPKEALSAATSFRLMAASLVLMLAPPASSLPLSEYLSENFVVYSDDRESNVREFVEELEIYRLATLLFMGSDPSEQSTPVTILNFSEDDSFALLGLPTNSDSLYRVGPSGALTLFQPSYHVQDFVALGVATGTITEKGNAASSTRHQYAHHVLRSLAKSPLPPWYEAGLSNLLTVSSIEDHRISIGAVPFDMEWSYLASDSASIRTVLDDNDLKEIENNAMDEPSTTAWLLTHYLLIDSMVSKRNNHRESLPSYLNSWSMRSDPIAVFETSFGITVDDMDRELKRYRRKGTIPVIRLDRPKMSTTISRQELTESEAAFVYARTAYELGATKEAAKFLRSYDGYGRWNQQAMLLAATLHCRLGETTSPATSEELQIADLDLLALQVELAWARYESCDMNNLHYLEKIIENAERAIGAGQEQPSVYRVLGLALQQRGDLVEAARSLMRAYELNPTYPQLNLELALFLQGFGRPDLAAPFADRAAAWATNPDVYQHASKLSTELAKQDSP